MTPRRRGPKKPPKVSYRFIRPDSDVGKPMYALLDELVETHHDDVRQARIALAWNTAWKADADGRVTLGLCRKVSNLEREVADVAAYDFVIILRREFWNDLLVTEVQKRALLDHELCHASVKLDDQGDQVIDECGRTVYRLRKHDLEEFSEIAGRYGCWKRDLERFAKALDKVRTPQWVGYSSLRQKLVAVGVELSVETVAQWSDEERDEARIWAELTRDLQQNGATGELLPLCPEHVQIASGALVFAR
jgi:hypothetical protein